MVAVTFQMALFERSLMALQMPCGKVKFPFLPIQCGIELGVEDMESIAKLASLMTPKPSFLLTAVTVARTLCLLP